MFKIQRLKFGQNSNTLVLIQLKTQIPTKKKSSREKTKFLTKNILGYIWQINIRPSLCCLLHLVENVGAGQFCIYF